MKAFSITLCCIGIVALVVGSVLITLCVKPGPSTAAANPQTASLAKPPVASVSPSSAPPTTEDSPKKNPRIMMIVETPKANHAWVNYWDSEGVQRGVHVVCPVSQAANQSQRNMRLLLDLFRLGLTKGVDIGAWASLGKDARPAEAPKPQECQVLRRTWHYTYGDSGHLEMVEGNSNLGPVKVPD